MSAAKRKRGPNPGRWMPPYWPKQGDHPAKSAKHDSPAERRVRLNCDAAWHLDRIMRWIVEGNVSLLRWDLDCLLDLVRAAGARGDLYDPCTSDRTSEMRMAKVIPLFGRHTEGPTT